MHGELLDLEQAISNVRAAADRLADELRVRQEADAAIDVAFNERIQYLRLTIEAMETERAAATGHRQRQMQALIEQLKGVQQLQSVVS